MPEEFDPVFTIFGFVIIILGGLGSYFGVIVGSVILMTLLEGTRYVELPLAADKVAAIRFIIVGLVAHPADGVPAAGHLRQEAGDAAR